MEQTIKQGMIEVIHSFDVGSPRVGGTVLLGRSSARNGVVAGGAFRTRIQWLERWTIIAVSTVAPHDATVQTVINTVPCSTNTVTHTSERSDWCFGPGAVRSDPDLPIGVSGERRERPSVGE